MLIEIKHWNGALLHTIEADSIKAAVQLLVGRGANLRGADLGGADLVGANLVGADLRGAHLVGANLVGAHLGGAHLGGANLVGADLVGADLVGANLVGADLRGAHLVGADLVGANLVGADLGGAKNLTPDWYTPLRLLRDQPGKIRAYKLVNEQSEGPMNGGIVYQQGQSYEVLDAATDEAVDCAKGISLATLDWCLKEWKVGYKVLLAEFTAQDIAAIPHGTDGKFRVFRCAIVGEKDVTESVKHLTEKPS